MLTDRHPADELADLRTQIRSLKAREMELRRALLHGPCGLQGIKHEAVFRKQRRRVFLKSRLPAYILSESSLWETRVVTHLLTQKREDVQPSARPFLRAVRPGDPVCGQHVMNIAGTNDVEVDDFEVIESAHQFG